MEIIDIRDVDEDHLNILFLQKFLLLTNGLNPLDQVQTLDIEQLRVIKFFQNAIFLYLGFLEFLFILEEFVLDDHPYEGLNLDNLG